MPHLQDFLDPIKQWFSAINIKKTQSLMKKRKTKKEALDIHNEIKNITSSDETFEL
jgi:hypothetical protein